MTSYDQLTTWLNSAYAMEKSMVQVLENHAKDAKELPEVRQRDEQHLEETRRHAQQIERCLELLNEKPSKTKTAMGNIMGLVQGASTGMYRDELVKNFLSDYAAEQFEIASYRSLIAAAEELGKPEIARICEGILEEEEAMAEWLIERIPGITRMTLQQQHAHA